jgi:hypothetical protein
MAGTFFPTYLKDEEGYCITQCPKCLNKSGQLFLTTIVHKDDCENKNKNPDTTEMFARCEQIEATVRMPVYRSGGGSGLPLRGPLGGGGGGGGAGAGGADAAGGVGLRPHRSGGARRTRRHRVRSTRRHRKSQHRRRR